MDYINVAIAINDKFMMPVQVMLHALCRQSSRPVQIFLLYNALSDENRAIIRNIMDGFGGVLREFMINELYFKNASLDNNSLYSIEIYYRILLPYITDVEKILWIDADIIIKIGRAHV